MQVQKNVENKNNEIQREKNALANIQQVLKQNKKKEFTEMERKLEEQFAKMQI